MWEMISRYVPRYFKTILEVDTISKKDQSIPVKTSNEIQKGLADLEIFLTNARNNAERVVVFYHPEMKELETKHKYRAHDIVQQLCTQLGVEFRSLIPVYTRVLINGELPYRDNIHINEIGQNILADTIQSIISCKKFIRLF